MQTRPLVPLQSDHEPDTGRKILTCYLLPQRPPQDSGGLTYSEDEQLFCVSVFNMQQIVVYTFPSKSPVTLILWNSSFIN